MVDDFIGQGGTLANPRGWIEKRGGNAVGAVACCMAFGSRVMEKVAFCLAATAAEQLGGADAIGREVHSDADMAVAVDKGFTAKTIDALRSRGVSDHDLDNLIIKPRTLSHRRANRSKLTVEESDRTARVARAIALAEKTFARTRPIAGFASTCAPWVGEPPWSSSAPMPVRGSSRTSWRESSGVRPPDADVAFVGGGLRGAFRWRFRTLPWWSVDHAGMSGHPIG